jgi:hypothetical protein
MAGLKHPVTPDGRYFVVRGRLWRPANPGLSLFHQSAAVRARTVRSLAMVAEVVHGAPYRGWSRRRP